MEMLRIARDEPRFPHDTWKFEILNDRVQVPDVETTYWCRVNKLPDALKIKYHLLRSRLYTLSSRFSSRIKFQLFPNFRKNNYSFK